MSANSLCGDYVPMLGRGSSCAVAIRLFIFLFSFPSAILDQPEPPAARYKKRWWSWRVVFGVIVLVCCVTILLL